MAILILLLGALTFCDENVANLRTESFDREPNWEARNNRATHIAPREVKQDFGYERSAEVNSPGRIGGNITVAAEPAFYAAPIADKTLDVPFSASGTLSFSGGNAHFLVAFFNEKTVNEWRTPNSVALRISVRGDRFLAWVEYATARWRAGGDDPKGFPTQTNPATGKSELAGFETKGLHHWNLRYDPAANQGGGAVFAEIDGVTAVCHIADGHRADGAVFNRFGLLNVMKSADDSGTVWLAEVAIDGQKVDLTREPGWDGRNNRHRYVTTNIRPRFDFGYSLTDFAHGQAPGELGGLVFRGDCRYPERMASYADRLADLTLERPIVARGKVALRRGVSDSTVLFGFFNDRESMEVNPAQDAGLPKSFLGISTDGPSREGFYFSPTYRLQSDARGALSGPGPRIYPDGKGHDFSLTYSPSGSAGRGDITVTLDGERVVLALGEGHKSDQTHFNRFGLITTWIDGNGQHLFFDDLTYTCRQ